MKVLFVSSSIMLSNAFGFLVNRKGLDVSYKSSCADVSSEDLSGVSLVIADCGVENDVSLAAIEKIRNSAGNQTLPVIVLSGIPDFYRCGAKSLSSDLNLKIIRKPFDTDELFDSVSLMTGRRISM